MTGWRCATNVREAAMKAEIHPPYGKLTATCSCGNVVEAGSTLSENIHLDVCSACHPFYTGKQKIADAGGRIDRFNKRFGAMAAKA
jgi:large subunit ribosomal protein L31